jgi:exonuclease III
MVAGVWPPRAPGIVTKGAARAPPTMPVSFDIQNCNSFNLAGLSSNLDLKIAAITTNGADIIFLSDTRLVSLQGVSASQRLKNCLRDCSIKKYELISNSTMNSRGVAVLVSTEIDFTVSNNFRDIDENFLILECTINGVRYGIGAVYGPNNTSRSFYNGLSTVIRTLQASGITNLVIGGDWNTTWDRRPVTENIDTFCMAGLPNAKNSELLENMCNEFGLIDPFRALYPDRREYTYLPFGNVRLNRSRLDFFIISNTMLDMVHDCTVDCSLKCKLFDHKCVTLTIHKRMQQRPKKDLLSNNFLAHKAMLFSVEIATRKTHLYSLDLESPLAPVGYVSVVDLFNREKARIDVLIIQFKHYVGVLEREAVTNRNVLLTLEKEAKETEIRLQLDDMIPLEILSTLSKRCNDIEFFLALTTKVKKNASKTQRILAKHKSLRISKLAESLNQLKSDYSMNSISIAEIETEIKVIRDCDLRDRIKDIKIFECLNAEKATPLMVSLAKKTHSKDSLDCIVDGNGNGFELADDRNKFIESFYTDLYKRDTNVQGEIEDFLGPAICMHPTVVGSKLTEMERAELDRPLQMCEMDKALTSANMRSAPGIDGYSNRFIREFWNFFRGPLLNCSTVGLENHSLPEFFMTAVIKLIPKKGDITKIGNWRPISLLSNFYKIISRAINVRLQQIVDRVLSRAQKGFTKPRQIPAWESQPAPDHRHPFPLLISQLCLKGAWRVD